MRGVRGRRGSAVKREIEISRAVSLLRSVLRVQLQTCTRAIVEGDRDVAHKEISEIEDKLKRAMNVLNCLR